jgi:hypothetical protein
MPSLSAPIEVVCKRKRCSKSFFLYIQPLEFTTGNPAISPVRFEPVLVSCPHCRRVSGYESGNKPPLVPNQILKVNARAVTLECQCGGLSLVFSFADVSDWESEVSEWSFGRSGHCSNCQHPFNLPRVVQVSEPD